MIFFNKSKTSNKVAQAQSAAKPPAGASDEAVWKGESEGIRLRQYENYDAYLEHQASKFSTLDLTKYSDRFQEALSSRLRVIANVPRGANVLCLGARNGAECEVFIKMGYFAVGIDVNPGPNNRTVLFGDFHHLQFADSSVDVIYTNALDHTFDFAKVLNEVRRLLKPSGIFIAEIVRGSKESEGGGPGAYESAWWDNANDLASTISKYGLVPMGREPFSYPWQGVQCTFARP